MGGDEDTIRAAYAALNERDLERALEALAPEIEWQPSLEFPESGPFVGFGGVERHFRGLWDDFEERYELEEVMPAAEHVVAIGMLRSRGRTSGARGDYRFGHVWTMRDGRATRVQIFLRPEEAFESIGVRWEA